MAVGRPKKQKDNKPTTVVKKSEIVISEDTLYSSKHLTPKEKEIRTLVYNDIVAFVKWIAPYFMLSDHHIEMLRFLTNENAKTHQLLLVPRGHGKSQIMTFFTVWNIIKDPRITILYASSTATLAEQQLHSIKTLLEQPKIFKFFPNLINKEEGRREKWTQQNIKVDHPIRKVFGIRDDTITIAGVGKGITGLHFDMLVLDDITAPNTDADPWTQAGRDKVERWVSQAASILNAGGSVKIVGTRYHPKDIYASVMSIKEPILDEEGNVVDEISVYEKLEKVVEVDGEFLFPRRKHIDGKYYGFDMQTLNKIKAQYIDKTQFYAQYYNTPDDPDNKFIDENNFQYYEKSHLNFVINEWRIGNKPLRIYAALDIAATISKRSDYTALVVVGVDQDGFRYVLDIRRKKTEKISDIADEIYSAWLKWRFIKLRAEVTATQGLVINQLQEMMRQRNAIFSWDKQNSRTEKRMRIMSILEPLYAQKIIFHYKGGNCQILEEELLSKNPAHDDVADATAACCELIQFVPIRKFNNDNIIYHPKFGGIL